MIDPDTREFLERLGKKPAADHVDHESARRARVLQEDTRPSPAPDPILDSTVDIPLDRMAREFRKRAGRAYGLGDDAKAKAFRDLCAAVENCAKVFP